MRPGCLRPPTVQLLQLRLRLLHPVRRCTHGARGRCPSHTAIVHDVAQFAVSQPEC